MEEQTQNLAFLNPNRTWVMQRLVELLAEWKEWQATVETIQDHPYDKNKVTEIFADGVENMKKHEILQAKTLTFLNNNIEGHGFIKGFDGHGCDRTDLRLNIRVDHRIHELNILLASLEYALVPDSFWKTKAKQLVDRMVDKTADESVDLLAGYLKNPLLEAPRLTK